MNNPVTVGSILIIFGEIELEIASGDTYVVQSFLPREIGNPKGVLAVWRKIISYIQVSHSLEKGNFMFIGICLNRSSKTAIKGYKIFLVI